MIYNPNEVVKDGPFTAPRVWQHLLKVLIGATAYAGMLALLRAIDPAYAVLAVFAGPLTFTVAITKEWLRPTDPAVYTRWLTIEDHVTDAACYCAPSFLGELGVHHLWLWMLTASVLLYGSYRLCRSGARP